MRILFLTLLLAGCNMEGNYGADAHEFQKAQFVQTQPKIEFVLHKNLQDLRDTAPASIDQTNKDLFGYSELRWDDAGYTCKVHIVDAANRYMPEWIGHEVTHCIYGDWHD